MATVYFTGIPTSSVVAISRTQLIPAAILADVFATGIQLQNIMVQSFNTSTDQTVQD